MANEGESDHEVVRIAAETVKTAANAVHKTAEILGVTAEIMRKNVEIASELIAQVKVIGVTTKPPKPKGILETENTDDLVEQQYKLTGVTAKTDATPPKK